MRNILLFIILLITSCGTPPVTTKDSQKILGADTGTAIFNIPSLLGKSIDEIRKVQGKPTDAQAEPPSGVPTDQWENNFEKEGQRMLITFNPNTRKVIDFFIPFNDGAGEDYNSLLPTGNVNNQDARYIIKPVPAISQEGKYKGYKVIPIGDDNH